MLATLAVAALLFDPSPPGDSGVLEGISRAFVSSVDHNGRATLFAVVGAVLAAAVAVAMVLWLRREAAREHEAQSVLDEEHRVAISEPPARRERRQWVRVRAQRAMAVLQSPEGKRARYDVYETQNLGGGGLAFLTHKPPLKGTPLDFTLDLGERSPLPMRGVVIRVEPPPAPEAPALVAVNFGVIDNATREHLVQWIAKEEMRAIAEAHAERVCTCCHRPLADGAAEMHTTCAERATAPKPTSPPPVPSRIVPPRAA
jgi:hypothetical protein